MKMVPPAHGTEPSTGPVRRFSHCGLRTSPAASAALGSAQPARAKPSAGLGERASPELVMPSGLLTSARPCPGPSASETTATGRETAGGEGVGVRWQRRTHIGTGHLLATGEV